MTPLTSLSLKCFAGTWSSPCTAIILLLSASVVHGALDAHKHIQTEYGPIRGRLEMTAFDNKPMYAFRGIPYAQSPVGEFRFKPPVAPEPWGETIDTFEYGNECIQKSFISKQVVGAEDCLFLNVFVPAAPSTKLAVMIFTHGGAFYFGSGNGYGPDFLVNNGVILVTLNYRLGPYGFLSLGTPEYSGNMGLKDQLAAIKWVNRNIDRFGGDVKRITIFGESAGSASTHYQILSPKSQGFYQRAIMQSGSALSPFAFQTRHDQLELLYSIGRKFGSELKNVDDILKFINLVDPELLILESIEDLYYPGVAQHTCDTLFAPLVEVPDALEPFLTETPKELIRKKATHNIDLMIGLNTAEMYFATLPELLNPELLKPFDKTFEIQLPWIDWKFDFNSSGYKQLAREIRNFYIPKGKPLNSETYYNYNQMISDAWFVYGIDKSAKFQAKRSKGKTFYYTFDLDTELNLFKTAFGQAKLNLKGASHLDELIYLFYFSFENILLHDNYQSLTEDTPELKGIRLMTSLWTNFAKYGTPTPECDPIDYPPIVGSKLNYVQITNDGLIKGTNPMREKVKFWDNLLEKYGYIFTKPPYDTVKDEL